MTPWVDVFSPMVYHRMCGESVDWIHSRVRQFVHDTGKPVWPIIQACSVPDELTEQEFLAAIANAENEPSGGVILFAMNHILKEDRLESVRRAWVKP